MARPPFAPDDHQRRALRHIASLAKRRQRIEDDTDIALLIAIDLRVPKRAIAQFSGLDPETVRRRLERLTRTNKIAGGPA